MAGLFKNAAAFLASRKITNKKNSADSFPIMAACMEFDEKILYA